MLGTTSAGNNTSGVVNPYIRAYKAGAPGVGTTHYRKIDGPLPEVLGLPIIRARRLTDHQLRKWVHASRHASAASLGRSRSLDIGAAAFKATIAPTVGDLLVHSQRDYAHPSTFPGSRTIPSCSLAGCTHYSWRSRFGLQGTYRAGEQRGVRPGTARQAQ